MAFQAMSVSGFQPLILRFEHVGRKVSTGARGQPPGRAVAGAFLSPVERSSTYACGSPRVWRFNPQHKLLIAESRDRLAKLIPVFDYGV
jgi:hypothetical protein